MNNSVSNSTDLGNRLDNAHILVYESVENELKSLCMCRHSNSSLVILSAGNLELEARLAADLLADTLCNNLLVIHIDKLELE